MFRYLIRLLLIVAFMLATGISEALAGSANLTEAVTWLESESHRLIRASERIMKNSTAAFPPQVGIGYEAFWLRDFAYTLEGSIDSYSEKELREACKLFIHSIRADGAGVDCVTFDGRPISMQVDKSCFLRRSEATNRSPPAQATTCRTCCYFAATYSRTVNAGGLSFHPDSVR